MDKDLRAVVEFMQENVECSKLMTIADALPQLSRLLWGSFPQESVEVLSVRPTKTECNQSQLSSIV